MKNNFVTPKTIGLLFLFTSILLFSCKKKVGLESRIKNTNPELLPASQDEGMHYEGLNPGPIRLRINRFGNIDYLNTSDGC